MRSRAAHALAALFTPSPDQGYDWSQYDSLVANAARNGVRATIYSSPTWAERRPETPPLRHARRSFQVFVASAVDRYGTEGRLWSEHPDLARLPITAWQLWNEPNSPLFWKPAPGVDGYLTLRAFHAAVKGVDPAARILLAGLPDPARGGLAGHFLSGLCLQGAARSCSMRLQYPPYASTPRVALERSPRGGR